MADNVIKVSVTSTKSQRVSVSSSQQATNITASPDTGRFWSQTSKNWAVSENIVDGEDYSSKYYANKSKQFAQNAEGYSQSTRETYNTFVSDANDYRSELTELKDAGVEEINEAVASGKDEINSTKTTIINDIEFVADGEKKEIEDLADLIKENAEEIASRTSFAMFDTVLKDHVLTYEESKGLALQGTYVYKDAIAGSRYGYADFYNKVVEEYNEATTTETVNGVEVKVHSNGHKFYDIADKEAIDGFFNTMGSAWFYGVDIENECIFLPRNNYLTSYIADGDKSVSIYGNGKTLGLIWGDGSGVHTAGMSWSITNTHPTLEKNNALYNATVGSQTTGVNTGSSSVARPVGVTTDASKSGIIGNLNLQNTQNDMYLYICVGNTVSDTSWVDVVTQVEGGVKDIEEAKDEAIDELKNIAGGTVPLGFIGSAILGIDETLGLQRYLNGQIIIQDQFKGFTKFLKRRIELYPSLACTENEWQTTVTMSDFSQCGKFVIDDNAGTIRLPKVVNIQGLTDLSKLAEIVEAGLPNITGEHNISGSRGILASSTAISGCFVQGSSSGKGSYGNGSDNPAMNKIGFDASKSNDIYGNSNTVQQEQIQYPYFIQVATGAETEDNIINEIELNNPFSLLDYKFSEYELNNISWLRSNGQYNSKAIYPAVYDLLLKIYNGTETKAGVSVKLSTDAFTDYEFVLNTAEETFRLPIKVKLASGKAVVGNGMTIGVTDGTNNYGLGSGTAFLTAPRKENYGQNVGVSLGATAKNFDSTIGITTDPTKSGIETSDNELYLYFYVGETVQNANLINAGRIEEIKANRSELDGNWIYKGNKAILTEVSVSSTFNQTYDLSSILPDDGNVYDVEFWGYGYTASTAHSICSIVLSGGYSDVQFCKVDNMDRATTFDWASSVRVLVDTNRQIQVRTGGASNTSTVWLYVTSYRKVR